MIRKCFDPKIADLIQHNGKKHATEHLSLLLIIMAENAETSIISPPLQYVCCLFSQLRNNSRVVP